MVLTLAVLGVHGVSVVTGLTDLTARPSGVEQAPQTLPCGDVTMSRLAYVRVTVAVAAHAGAADRLRVTVETTCTPEDAESGVRPGPVRPAEVCGRHLSQVRPAYPSWQRSQDT